MNPSYKDNLFVVYSDKIKCFEQKTGDETEYFIEGHISTPDLDLVDDIVTKSCLDDMFDQFEERVIKLDFEHEAFMGEDDFEAEVNKTKSPLGKAIDRTRDSTGLRVKWKLNPAWKKLSQRGDIVKTFQEVWGEVKGGYLDAFSIAYIPLETTGTTREEKAVRLIHRLTLLNTALTGNPINTKTVVIKIMAKSLEFIKTKEDSKMEGKEVKSAIEKLQNTQKEYGEKLEVSEKKAGELDKSLVEIKGKYETLEEKNKTLEKDNVDMKVVMKKAFPKGFEQNAGDLNAANVANDQANKDRETKSGVQSALGAIQ